MKAKFILSVLFLSASGVALSNSDIKLSDSIPSIIVKADQVEECKQKVLEIERNLDEAGKIILQYGECKKFQVNFQAAHKSELKYKFIGEIRFY